MRLLAGPASPSTPKITPSWKESYKLGSTVGVKRPSARRNFVFFVVRTWPYPVHENFLCKHIADLRPDNHSPGVHGKQFVYPLAEIYPAFEQRPSLRHRSAH